MTDTTKHKTSELKKQLDEQTAVNLIRSKDKRAAGYGYLVLRSIIKEEAAQELASQKLQWQEKLEKLYQVSLNLRVEYKNGDGVELLVGLRKLRDELALLEETE